MSKPSINPELDLVLERVVDVAPELVWQAWTEPRHLEQWFTPKPWTTHDVVIDLRPGGLFRTTMRSPDGDSMTSDGCYLEVVPNRKLVWTDALGADYRPNAESFFTAEITLEPTGDGTKYTVVARHADPDARKRHEEMGFHHGWGTALDQLVAYMKTI